MQARKSIFSPIALAVGVLLSTGAFAQVVISDGSGKTIGTDSLSLMDTTTIVKVGSSITGLQINNERILFKTYTQTSPTSGEEVPGTLITNDSIRTQSIRTSDAAFTGNVNFTGAQVTGLTGLFDPTQVGALGAVTTLNKGGQFNLDLVEGGATLG